VRALVSRKARGRLACQHVNMLHRRMSRFIKRHFVVGDDERRNSEHPRAPRPMARSASHDVHSLVVHRQGLGGYNGGGGGGGGDDDDDDIDSPPLAICSSDNCCNLSHTPVTCTCVEQTPTARVSPRVKVRPRSPSRQRSPATSGGGSGAVACTTPTSSASPRLVDPYAPETPAGLAPEPVIRPRDTVTRVNSKLEYYDDRLAIARLRFIEHDVDGLRFCGLRDADLERLDVPPTERVVLADIIDRSRLSPEDIVVDRHVSRERLWHTLRTVRGLVCAPDLLRDNGAEGDDFFAPLTRDDLEKWQVPDSEINILLLIIFHSIPYYASRALYVPEIRASASSLSSMASASGTADTPPTPREPARSM